MACYPERRKGRLTGTWIAETVLHGSTVRKRFKTHKEGLQWADLVRVTGVVPEAPQSTSGPTFRDVAERCHAANKTWREGRDPNLRGRLELVCGVLGDLPVTKVDAEALERLAASLRRRPSRHGRRGGGKVGGKLSSGTVNRHLAIASRVLHYAAQHRLIQGVPYVPLSKEAPGRIHWLSVEQENAVVSALLMKGWHTEALVVRVLVATGMRWGELEGLTPDQIEDEDIRLWKTKTDHPRSLYIPQELARSLRALVAARGLPKYDTMRRRFTSALKAAGVTDYITLHSLRHTTASRLVQEGTDIRIVQEVLGHAQIKTTQRYTHINRETLRTAMKKLTPHAGETEQSVAEKVSEINA